MTATGSGSGRRFVDLQPTTRMLAVIGAGLLVVVVGMAVLADVVAAHPPDAASGDPYLSPSGDHWLGTDDLGRDLWAQLVFGARVSIAVGLIAAVAATVIGLTAALVAGWYQGWVDVMIMRVVDITLSLPFLVLVLVLAAYFGRGLTILVLLIAAVLWARPARLLRSQVLKLATAGHVVAAKAMGAGTFRILYRHLLPRLVPLLLSQFVRAAVVAVVVQSGVAFLGLGDPTRPSWGTTLYFANNGNAILTDAWLWWVVPPGIALAVLTVGLAFVGYALEEWAEPLLVSHGWRRPVTRTLSAEPPAPAPDNVVLDIRDLTVSYLQDHELANDRPPRVAVDDVSLAVGAGRMLGLVGGSGCGKSTVANAVLGLLPHPGRVTEGVVMLGEQDLRRLGRARLGMVRGREVCLVPQAAMSSLNPTMTAHQQVAEAAALVSRADHDPSAAATEALERVGISQDRHESFPHELSGGQRQRVAIAMAVVNRPRLLIADEPTTGLDVITQQELVSLLQDLRRDLDLDILLISHDLPLVSSSCDDVVVMHTGRVVERGSVETVISDPKSTATRELVAAFPRIGQRLDDAGNSGGGPSSQSHSSVALAFDDVTVEYRGRRLDEPVAALRSVSLTINTGERVAVVGRSGAGKSTLARVSTGLVLPTSGTADVLGVDVARLRGRPLRELRRRVQTVFQDPYDSLHPGMTVAQIVAEPLAVAGVAADLHGAAVDQALVSVGVQPPEEFRHRHVGSLSGGQRQRVALARTLVAKPELILADEPTSMLDALLRKSVAQQLLAVQVDVGATLIFITHDLALAGMLADRIVVMADGEVVEDGPVESVLFDPQHDETARLLDAASATVTSDRSYQ